MKPCLKIIVCWYICVLKTYTYLHSVFAVWIGFIFWYFTIHFVLICCAFERIF